MFRVHFVPALGKFVIQVSAWFGLSWKTVKHLDEGRTHVDLTFETYKAAMQHVENIGLNDLYRDRSDNRYRDYMMAQRGAA